jgi:pimeloyl-ACP methyl ester carboxylesterase
MKLAAMIVLALLLATLIGGGVWLYTPDKPRAALEARYLNAPTDYQLVAGIRLHVRDSGPRNAPVVILLHGFGASLQTWEPWAERLSTDHRVIRFDLPGFGLTGPDPTGDYSDGRSLHVLAALMDRLGVERASLIGNSLGGRIAWKFAAQNPDRVDKLVLISPDGFASPGFEYGKKPTLPLMMRLLPYTLPRALLRMSLAPAYGDPKALTDATVTRYRDLMLAPGVRRAILARTEQVMLEDPVPSLRRIQAPTLLLWGEKDAMIPVTNAADYVRAMPHATLVSFPGLGHVPFEEAPAVSLEPVRPFLASAGTEAGH